MTKLAGVWIATSDGWKFRKIKFSTISDDSILASYNTYIYQDRRCEAMNKIILYIATLLGLECLIADTNGGVDWLPYQKDYSELEAGGYKNLMFRIGINFGIW